uniref:Uncharacterized protein n=1 Tax=Anguilla anguilla TaxID=7936 RepID=A0A0E9VH76_ANGAN
MNKMFWFSELIFTTQTHNIKTLGVISVLIYTCRAR